MVANEESKTILKKNLGLIVFAFSLMLGLLGGYLTLEKDTNPVYHMVLDGITTKTLLEKPYEQWTENETTLIVYTLLDVDGSLFARPFISLEGTTQYIFWLLTTGGIGCAIMRILDKKYG